jgi:chemosensory pili system protein ChpA (sensor histidine kinase/response regulator)
MVWRFQQETGRSAEEFDPLEFDRFTLQQELSRGVMESLGDIESVQDTLEDALRDAEMLLTQQGRLGQTLQDGLMGARLVRFEDVVPRLKRLVRQVARDLGKQAELTVHGGEVELDRGLLNTLVPAFEHMLRNSLAHGIERPDERAARGKSREGHILLRIASQGGVIQMVLEDDGAGIDVEAVRRKARENGILDRHAAEDDQAAMQLIFRSGISTAREVSMVAGRGVGMDVVAEALRQVGGDIQVESQRGVGTRFKLHVPLTQSITHGIAVTAGEQIFALPYSGIEAILRAPGAQLNALLGEDEPTWEHAGQALPLVDLSTLLGLPGGRMGAVEGMSPLLVLRLGDRRMVLRIDGLQGSQQLFIKALGPFLAKAPALAGATLLGDGRVVLVLDVAELFLLASQARTKPMAAQEAEARRAQVLVVDDSVTIRKVTTRILERYGIEVATAKDGVDALAWLHDHKPTVVLSDIEMPRMDGFELLASIRNDARLRDLPVIMITSRTGQKHREKAEGLGVNAYLGKPYTEADLMHALRAWLPEEIGHMIGSAGSVA